MEKRKAVQNPTPAEAQRVGLERNGIVVQRVLGARHAEVYGGLKNKHLLWKFAERASQKSQRVPDQQKQTRADRKPGVRMRSATLSRVNRAPGFISLPSESFRLDVEAHGHSW